MHQHAAPKPLLSLLSHCCCAGSIRSLSMPPSAPHPADGQRYACWRPLVAPDRDQATLAAPTADQCLAALRMLRQHGGRWAVIMLRGGHFVSAAWVAILPKHRDGAVPAMWLSPHLCPRPPPNSSSLPQRPWVRPALTPLPAHLPLQAAAVFNVDPARVANPRQADKFEALAHKSAHRYVVR